MKNVFIQKTKIFKLTVIKCLSVGDTILRASGILTHLILIAEVQECWKHATVTGSMQDYSLQVSGPRALH